MIKDSQYKDRSGISLFLHCAEHHQGSGLELVLRGQAESMAASKVVNIGLAV